jgi:hypothetical protein
MIGGSLGKPTVCLSGLDIPSVKQSNGFAGAIPVLRCVRVTELATVPGEEDAASAVGVLARASFLTRSCCDVVAESDQFSRHAIDAGLPAS